MEKKGLDILSNTFKPEWRDILSRTPEGVKETSLALLKKHKDDVLMDLQPIVLTQIVQSSKGVGAVLTEFVAGHPDGSILDVPRYLRRAMEQTPAGQTAVVEALIEKYPDVLSAPADVQRKLSKTSLGRNAVSEALIKQHPDVLKAPPDVQKQLAKSFRGRNAISEALLAKYEGKPLEDVSPTDLARIEQTVIGRTAITDVMLSKYKSVQEISPEDLARLKSLNTPRARDALSIKDAGGHLLSFDHMVQTYFMIHGPSTRDDIAQWISNNWKTYFGSWKRFSIHVQLTKALELGPYKTILDGTTVKWARQGS